MTEGALLELRGVTTRLPVEGRPRAIVEDVSFSIRSGEVVGLVGESGSGKSMTARTILRLLPPRAAVDGEVLLEGDDVLRFRRRKLRELRARRIAMVFQDPRAHINPLWTSGEFLMEDLRVNRGLSRTAARARARALLVEVGIRDPDRVLRAYPDQLSGGMLQRVMIAGALAGEPQLIIADEPTTALDVTIQAEIAAIFAQLKRDHHVAMLFISHDLELASALCDRILVMYAGRIVEEQQTARLFDAPLHPYTAGLLNARPRLEAPRQRLTVIPGRPARAAEMPAGCPFHPRCAFVQDRCTTQRPPLRPLDGGLTACLRTEEIRGALRAEGVHEHVG